MNTARIAKGWALIAQGAMELSLAYESIEPAVARTAVSESGGAQAGPPQLPPTPTDYDDEPRLKPQVDAGLGLCPVHGTPWIIKPAGVSKAGKRYSAFYKCAERDADGFCNEKPQQIWQDSHPIREAA